MYMQISCSCCGHRSRKYTFDAARQILSKAPDEIIRAGWDSFGSAYYCPDCARTWEERNGKDRPLWGDAHTRERLLETMVDTLMTKIEMLEGTWEP